MLSSVKSPWIRSEEIPHLFVRQFICHPQGGKIGERKIHSTLEREIPTGVEVKTDKRKENRSEGRTLPSAISYQLPLRRPVGSRSGPPNRPSFIVDSLASPLVSPFGLRFAQSISARPSPRFIVDSLASPLVSPFGLRFAQSISARPSPRFIVHRSSLITHHSSLITHHSSSPSPNPTQSNRIKPDQT